MPRIFISYRQKDSEVFADRIYERLVAEFGADNIFRDLASIQPGENWRGAIRRGVVNSDVMLVLIGPQWLQMLTDRAEKEVDWVRFEVQMGLDNMDLTRVIPVLLQDTEMPSSSDLPAALKGLPSFQAIRIRTRLDFDGDMARLIDKLRGVKSSTEEPKAPSTTTSAGENQQIGGSGNVQQNMGTVTGGTFIGNQHNYSGNVPQTSATEPKPALDEPRAIIRGSWITGLLGLIGVAATAVVAILIAQGAFNSTGSSPTPTMTEPATEEIVGIDLETATSIPQSSETPIPATMTEVPVVVASATPPSASQGDNLQLTIFRDEDSFTLLASQGSDLTGLTYRVTTATGTENYPLENYAGFRGLPFDNLPQVTCFRLIRSGGTRPTPLECQGGTLLLTHQLATADRFWRDGSAGLDRTVLVYRDADLLGTCGAGQDRCSIDGVSQTIVPTVAVLASVTPPLVATQIICQGTITSNTGASVQVRQVRQTNVAGRLIQSGTVVTIRERSTDNWYFIEYENGTGWIPVTNVEAFNDCA